MCKCRTGGEVGSLLLLSGSKRVCVPKLGVLWSQVWFMAGTFSSEVSQGSQEPCIVETLLIHFPVDISRTTARVGPFTGRV